MPDTPSRDLLLEQLNKKITTNHKVKKEAAVLKLIGSTPISSFIKRRESSFVRKADK